MTLINLLDTKFLRKYKQLEKAVEIGFFLLQEVGEGEMLGTRFTNIPNTSDPVFHDLRLDLNHSLLANPIINFFKPPKICIGIVFDFP